MKLDASDARNKTGPTISSGDAARRRNPACAIASCISGGLARTMSVSTVPGAERVHSDAAPGVVRSHRARERHEPGLARGIHRDVRREEERPGGDHVHDGRVLARLQVRQRLLHEEHRPAEVHVERLLPGLGRELAERLRQRVRGVVHDDVDTAEAVDRALHEIVQRIEVSGVRRDTQRVAAHRAQMRLGFGTRVGLAARDDDLGPRAHEPFGDRAADASGPAGDDRDASAQIEQ